MGKYEAIAHTIIDMVEKAIREAHPFIDKMARSYTVKGDIEGEEAEQPNTLLYGEVYYNLENEVVEVLRDNEEDTD